MQEYDDRNPEFVEEFIALYRSFPCLWRAKSKKNADRTQEAYDALVQKYREVDPRASKDTVKRKINILRTGFRKQLRNLNLKSSRPGMRRKPTLWYFNLFDFLDDFPKPPGGPPVVDSMVAESHDEDNEDLEPCDEADDDPTLPSVPVSCDRIHQLGESSGTSARNITRLSEHRNDGIEALVEPNYTSLLEDDASVVYGKHVANKLRQLNDLQNIFAQKLINDIIFEAEMGTLSRSCTLAGMDCGEPHFVIKEVVAGHSTARQQSFNHVPEGAGDAGPHIADCLSSNET